jgi:DNA replication and repair protein RecF
LVPIAETIAVTNFRLLKTAEVRLNPGFNVLVGANAQGKTSLLEALNLVSTTRLLRGRREQEAIRDGEGDASVSVTLAESLTQLSIHISRTAKKRASLNRASLPRAADLLGRLPTVSVTTADLELVRGDPSDRRMQLDLDLSSLSAAYLRDLTQYKKALEQRNSLLRTARERFVSEEAYLPWEQMMAGPAVELRSARRNYVDAINQLAAQIHAEMGNGEALRLEYEANDPAETEEQMIAYLAQSRAADIARGGSSVGPHRDDVAIFIENRDARSFGSQGQQRTAVISVKLASLEVAKSRLGFSPILLLDDMLSDLDESRRAFLVDVVLNRAGQALLTCTEASLAGDRLLNSASVFEVSAGEVTSA